AEEVCGRELPGPRSLDVVEARVEKAHPHLLAGELELLAQRDGEPAREHLSVAAHGGGGIDEEVVKAARLVRRLLARVKEDLVLDHAPGELELVPRELGEHERVERALVADAG